MLKRHFERLLRESEVAIPARPLSSFRFSKVVEFGVCGEGVLIS
jgi:hypothetical protein